MFEPSRFLHDIPDRLVQDREGRQKARQPSLGMGAGRFMGRPRPQVTTFSRVQRPRPVAAERPQPAIQQFQTGDQVQHKVFGQGVVIESKLVSGDEQVTVAFAGVGLKHMMASMAPMEKAEDA
jgi:DNA helicase-2/ATP-dependent DNA helicase PcrA